MKLSFAQLLHKTERMNRNALMHKAFTANRIAKSVKGTSRNHSYAVKTKALNAIIKKFPKDVVLRHDKALPEMIVVSIVHTKFGLHAPRTAIKT